MLATKKSLTRTTLIKMGFRIAMVIIAVTLLSYWHLMSVLQSQIQEQLAKYITERGLRESSIFLLAQDNAEVMKQQLLLRLKQFGEQDPQAEFDRLFVRGKEGFIQNRPEIFDGTTQASVFIDKNLIITPEIRRRMLVFYELATAYGTAWHNRFQDTYMIGPENMIANYWPEVPTWTENAIQNNLYMPNEEYFWIADQQHNPARTMAWTGIYYDVVGSVWMLSCLKPVDVEGRHIASVGHDIILNELFNRTITDHLQGTYNLIFREDGRLIVHPEHLDDIMKHQGNFNIAQTSDSHLQRLFQLVTNKPANTVVVDNATDGEYLAVTRLQGPNWYFVTVYPKSLLSSLAFQTARFILFLGMLSLLIEVLVLFWVLRTQVARPLQTFQEATERLANGDFTVQLDTSRQDELGRLANSFKRMAGELKLREENLATSNQQLSQEIVERKQIEVALLEAKDLAEVANREKMVSLGRLVAGFAHELNTPIGIAMGSASALQREAQKIRHLMAQEEVDVDELLAAVTSVENGFTLTLSNLERAANLVTSFKRTAVDQTSGEMRVFRVLEVIEDTINLLHLHFKQTSIQIQVTCPNELKVNSLPGALEQLLTNLLMNSLIHGFEEGQRAGQIQIMVQLRENQLHLEYSDNGKGIPPDHLPKIFEPFFTTHRAHGGSGLGMYICYNLVTTQLQGTLTVDSVLGKGVKFTIIFPVSGV